MKRASGKMGKLYYLRIDLILFERALFPVVNDSTSTTSLML